MGFLKRHPLIWIVPLVLLGLATAYITRLAYIEVHAEDTPFDYQI